jgi:hypothetical protein
MKSFFVSLFAGIASLFGVHFGSHTATSTLAKMPAQDVQEANLVITYPAGQDSLQAGQTYNVTWKNEGPKPISVFFNLEYTDQGYYIGQQRFGTTTSLQESVPFTIATNTPERSNYQVYMFDADTGQILGGSQAFTVKSNSL